MLHHEITEKILEASFEVINEMGAGFLESVYERALFVALVQKGLSVETQFKLNVKFRGVIVGEYCADMLVNGKVLVELKAVRAVTREHKAQGDQLFKSHGNRGRDADQFWQSKA